jgi:hypothetical protein
MLLLPLNLFTFSVKKKGKTFYLFSSCVCKKGNKRGRFARVLSVLSLLSKKALKARELREASFL